MRPRLALLCIIAVISLNFCVVATSQVATGGPYSFGVFDSKGFDTINIGNLNAHFAIPVFSKAGRGGLNFNHSLVYDSSIWTPVGVLGSQTWQPALLWGWQADTGPMTGNLSFSRTNLGVCQKGPPVVHTSVDFEFIYTDWNGTTHSFPDLFSIWQSHTCGAGSTISGRFSALDNAGIVLVATTFNNYTILLPNGQVIRPTYNAAASTTSIEDSNGNKIAQTGSVFTDTTGSTVLTLSGIGNSSSPRLLTYPTYVSGAASTAAVTVNYVSYNIQTAFGCSGISEYTASSVSLVDNIALADGQTYYFTYEATPGVSGKVTGRLASVKLPGGGHIDYTYSGGSNGIVCQDGGTATLTRSMPDDPASSSWTYVRTPGASGAANSHTDVTDGMATPNHATYDFVNATTDTYHTPYVVSQNQYNGPATGTPPLAVSTCYNGAIAPCTTQTLTLPYSSTVVTTSLDGTTSVKMSTQTFNTSGLLTAQTDYDYGSGSPGSQVAATAITYASLTNGIIGLPATVAISGGLTSPMQTTTYTYDGGTLTSTSGLPNHASITGSRGNLTSTSVALSTSTSIQTQSSAYDDAGEVLSSTDVLGNPTTYTYDSSTDTFALSVSAPTTGTVAHTASATYDVPSGVMLTSIDQNTNTTTYTYDNMLRPLTVSLPASGYQTYTYGLASSTPYVTASVLHSGSSYISTTNHFDAYGRVSEVESTDTPHNDLIDTSYDANGRLYKKSNPYRTGGTPVYTQYSYDALGRPTSVLETDSSNPTVTYSGNTTTVTDEAGKPRELVMDAAGRTIQVLEPNATGTPTLTLETDYQYDQNQTSGVGSPETYQTVITQKGGSGTSSDWRVRTFTYDSLGREVTSATPEAGTTTYTYPVSGSYCAANLSLPCTRTDANSTATTYAYDALSRLTGKTYSGSTIATNTSAVTYSYDQTSYNGLTISNGKGLRTGMSDGSGATAWSYDGLGNILAVRKTVNSVTKEADYTYNDDSTTNTMTDFGGTAFTYSYDVAGHPTQVVDGSSNSYAASAVYNAAGELTSLNHQLTSGGGAYVRSWAYNSRLQPSTISATLNSTRYRV